MPPAEKVLRQARFGLEAKFVLLATLIILVGTIVGNRLIIVYEEVQLYEQTRRETVVLAESMALSFLHTLIYEELDLVEEGGLLDLFIDEIMRHPDMAIRYVGVLDAEDRVLAHSDPSRLGQRDTSFRERYGYDLEETQTRRRRLEGEDLLEVAAPLHIASKSWGTLVLAVSLRPVEQKVHDFASRLFLLSLVAVGGCLLVSLLVARTLAGPIKRLVLAMAEIGPELESDLDVDRQDEIGLLQSSFLEMLSRLRAAKREQEQTHEVMMRTQKLASVGALAAGVAHEINNPLGGMKNCLAQMESRPEDGERRREYIALMKRALERIEQVVRGLLDFSRPRELQMGPVEIGASIETILQLLAYRLEKNEIDLELELEPELPVVTGDHYQLEQVLVNLVLNAVESMGRKGRLRIGAYREGECVRIHVQDTGPGVPPEMEERIFDPFFTTKEVGKGTGLGLTVSLRIVREHGGDLAFSNLPGGGAMFVMTLPVGSADAREEESERP